MTIHLLANATLLESPGAFQQTVYRIHSLGRFLPLIEWTFIFVPILFHGLLGVVFIVGGKMNTTRYPYTSNVRYMLQRVTGIIALVFILCHVFHMHGWFHNQLWLKDVVEPLGGYRFAHSTPLQHSVQP